MQKLLLLGDEAIAQGALDAGITGVYAYPGTPSTEVTEYIQHSKLAKEKGIHCTWSANEKTAMTKRPRWKKPSAFPTPGAEPWCA